jgi:hypothetical protein
MASRALCSVLWAVSCLAPAGCQTVGGAGPPPREARTTPTAPTVDVAGLDSLDMPPAEAADLSGVATAAHAANASEATMPGYNPAAGFAGELLGLAIAKGIEDASLRKKANEPIAPLRAVYAAHWRELRLREALLREWTAYCGARGSGPGATLPGVCLDEVVLRPRLRLLSGGRVLCVRIGASIQGSPGRSARNAVLTYLSAPVATTNIAEINDHWSRNHLQAIATEWSSAIDKLVPLLQIALEQPVPMPKTGPEAIRFENAAGLFYDRGIILSRGEHRITYQSLDGSITSAHMDRLLTTEAYYEWLLSKPHL